MSDNKLMFLSPLSSPLYNQSIIKFKIQKTKLIKLRIKTVCKLYLKELIIKLNVLGDIVRDIKSRLHIGRQT